MELFQRVKYNHYTIQVSKRRRASFYLLLLTIAACSLYAKAVGAVGSPTPSKTVEGIGIGSPNPGNVDKGSNHQQGQQESSFNTRKKQTQKKHQRNENTNLENKANQHDYTSFMHWCEAVLGIQSVVEIREFEYIDHLRMHWDTNDVDERRFDWLDSLPKDNKAIDEADGDERRGEDNKEMPTITVRGLAAKYSISKGDIVLSIPLYSLLSIPTTIDHDPVLSRLLGPTKRKEYGWNEEYEVPLLVVAILYHKSLEVDSPIWRYVDLLQGTSTESFPFLWSDKELRKKTGEIRVGVVELARGIKNDVWEMYDGVIGTLVRENYEVFGPPKGYDDEKGEEWHFSFENFQWAFAMVISRHHFLPISDFDDDNAISIGGRDMSYQTAKHESSNKYPTLGIKPDYSSVMHETLTSVSDIPPANQPTDSWVEEAINEERVSGEGNEANFSADDDVSSITMPTKHSFLAPLADLINFGPPCLTGSYNPDEHAFELIATCNFEQGQEITFWYSSDCSDVMVANYGFLHPLIPKCTSTEDWKQRTEQLEEQARIREEEMWDLYRRIELLKEELSEMNSQLVSCACEEGEKKEKNAQHNGDIHKRIRKDGHSSIRHEIGVRGHHHIEEDHDLEDL